MAELRSAGQPRTAVPTRSLFNDLADGAGAHRMAAFTDREPQAFFHRHRRDQLNDRSEEHTSELQAPCNLVCRLLLEKKKQEGILCLLALLLHIVREVRTELVTS